MNLVSVMRLLGHNDPTMTLRYAAIAQETVVKEYPEDPSDEAPEKCFELSHAGGFVFRVEQADTVNYFSLLGSKKILISAFVLPMTSWARSRASRVERFGLDGD